VRSTIEPDHLGGDAVMSKKPDELNMEQLDSASGGTGNGAPAGDLADVRLQTVMDQRS
jgi:hypothetical protein